MSHERLPGTIGGLCGFRPKPRRKRRGSAKPLSAAGPEFDSNVFERLALEFPLSGEIEQLFGRKWYSRRDSNLRLLPSEGSTLSTELREREFKIVSFCGRRGYDLDVLDADRFDGPLTVLWLNAGDQHRRVHTLNDLAEDRVAVVEALFAFQRDKELRIR